MFSVAIQHINYLLCTITSCHHFLINWNEIVYNYPTEIKRCRLWLDRNIFLLHSLNIICDLHFVFTSRGSWIAMISMLTSCSILLNSIRKGPQSTLGFHCRSVSLQLWSKEETPTNSWKAPGEGKQKEEEATAGLAHAEEVSMDAAESRLAFSCSKDVLWGMAWLTLSGKNYVKHPDSVQCSRVQLRSNLAATKTAEMLGSLTKVARKRKKELREPSKV